MSEGQTFDPRIQTENIAFDPSAMVACAACARSNPPNRLKCLYCGKELPVSAAAAANITPVLRKLEIFEFGYNLIVNERSPELDIHDAARLLSVDADEIAAILDTGVPLPIARVESETEALIIQGRLSGFGLRCTVVSDAQLAPEEPPARLRAIEFLDGRLALDDFNKSERVEVASSEFVLIVPGNITVDRVHLVEKKGRGKTKLIDEFAMASDEMLLDIYTRRDAAGFRVQLTGFDFSCLGDEKGLLAGENMRRLIARLSEHLPNAKLVNDYARIRRSLDRVWEAESRNDSRGLSRMGFGRVEFGSTATSSNLNQFTKYSRLQWHLLCG